VTGTSPAGAVLVCSSRLRRLRGCRLRLRAHLARSLPAKALASLLALASVATVRGPLARRAGPPCCSAGVPVDRCFVVGPARMACGVRRCPPRGLAAVGAGARGQRRRALACAPGASSRSAATRASLAIARRGALVFTTQRAITRSSGPRACRSASRVSCAAPRRAPTRPRRPACSRPARRTTCSRIRRAIGSSWAS